MLQIVLFAFLNHPMVKTSVEHGFDSGIHRRLQWPVQQIVQFFAIGFRHAIAKRLESISVCFRSEHFAADQRRQNHGKYRAALSPLTCEIRLHEPAQIADQHLVARADHDGRVIAMSFHLGCQHRSAEVPRQQPIGCGVCPLGQFLTGNALCHFKRQRIAEPDETNHAANRFLHSQVRRMIVSPVNHCNAGLTVHEVIENKVAIRRNAGTSESLFNQRDDHRDGLRPADQRIFEFARVHFHQMFRSFGRVRELYN